MEENNDVNNYDSDYDPSDDYFINMNMQNNTNCIKDDDNDDEIDIDIYKYILKIE